MAVNLSFVSHDEDLAGRGAMERHSLLNSVFTKVSATLHVKLQSGARNTVNLVMSSLGRMLTLLMFQTSLIVIR